MTTDPDVTRVAAAIGDPTRMRMLMLLMEGRALTAKELAYGAGVEPATATSHLRRLSATALIRATPAGRHKYFRLASPHVARLVESLMVLAPRPTPAPSRAPAVPADPLRAARLCYDHLAGRLGTGLTTALVDRGLIRPRGQAYVITGAGTTWLTDFGIDLAATRRTRRKLAYRCLDWTERTDHVAGALGAALAERLLTLDWIRRDRRSRAVAITPVGTRELRRHFGLALSTT
jgi:DNA-binding transcriptional ArsR family regulator